tara:strand:- start:1402 stop:1623 length:222 start_codon:yes stop_codon:yes gene_type:complete
VALKVCNHRAITSFWLHSRGCLLFAVDAQYQMIVIAHDCVGGNVYRESGSECSDALSYPAAPMLEALLAITAA